MSTAPKLTLVDSSDANDENGVRIQTRHYADVANHVAATAIRHGKAPWLCSVTAQKSDHVNFGTTTAIRLRESTLDKLASETLDLTTE